MQHADERDGPRLAEEVLQRHRDEHQHEQADARHPGGHPVVAQGRRDRHLSSFLSFLLTVVRRERGQHAVVLGECGALGLVDRPDPAGAVRERRGGPVDGRRGGLRFRLRRRRQLRDLDPQHPPPDPGEEHREHRPLQPVAHVHRAAHRRPRPAPLPHREEPARRHRAEREQMPPDPARGQDEPEHGTRLRRTGRHPRQPPPPLRRPDEARGTVAARADLADPDPSGRPADPRPGAAPARHHRGAGGAHRQPRSLGAAQWLEPDRRPAPARPAERAAGRAERPRSAGRPRRPRPAADPRDAARRLGRPRRVPAAAGRPVAARRRARRAPSRPRRAERRGAGGADRHPRAGRVPGRPGAGRERDDRADHPRRHVVAPARADRLRHGQRLGGGGGDGRLPADPAAAARLVGEPVAGRPGRAARRLPPLSGPRGVPRQHRDGPGVRPGLAAVQPAVGARRGPHADRRGGVPRLRGPARPRGLAALSGLRRRPRPPRRSARDTRAASSPGRPASAARHPVRRSRTRPPRRPGGSPDPRRAGRSARCRSPARRRRGSAS